jgi:glycosyltransferase involved in cell wall biosynthesis
MRILVFHGYLLSGTGSNVYNARLAEALVRLGHEVHLVCQDRHPEQQRFVDAAGDWESGALRVRTLRERVRCTTYRPDIGPVLPVYVADRYEGIEARTFLECSDAEVADYVAANVDAVREVADRVRPEAALANHLVMGPLIVARALARAVPYAVKIHGSALEYTVKASPERFLAPAREGLHGSRAVLVGSSHTASSLWGAIGDREVVRRTRLGPPGVDVARFKPLEEDASEPEADRRARSRELLGGLIVQLREHGEHEAKDAAKDVAGEDRVDTFARDAREGARALERLNPTSERLVAFVGKLIVNKGVDLLLAAWPLVLERVPDARLVVVGFGSYREALERLVGALGRGDLEQVGEIAALGSALESHAEGADPGDDAQPLRYLEAFLESLRGERRERYVAAAAELPARVVLTGRLEHDELAMLLPLCEAVVVPSTFPESFGMVAVEAAACGALPVSAEHSGLSEVSAVLARALAPTAARWLSFPLDEQAVRALAARVVDWLQADAELRAQSRRALVAVARERFSWEGVARGVIDAACGELGRLDSPRVAGTFG